MTSTCLKRALVAPLLASALLVVGCGTDEAEPGSSDSEPTSSTGDDSDDGGGGGGY